jgi:ubiquinone biosynthesis protein
MQIPELKEIHRLCVACSAEQLRTLLNSQLELFGEARCREIAAALLVDWSKPVHALPTSLTGYMRLVNDGFAFFLVRISVGRLLDAVFDQAKMAIDSAPSERLMRLALHFPTLHKLGQIVARRQDLDPIAKSWLVGLEHGRFTADLAAVTSSIEKGLELLAGKPQVRLARSILAEASVAAIVPFTWNPDDAPEFSGVFKVLKPGIKKILDEELRIIGEAADYFESCRQHYGLQELKIASLFHEVRDDLLREVDLTAEQANLRQAARQFETVNWIRVPRLTPLCSPSITGMERITAECIGNLRLPRMQLEELARKTFAALICIPLFATEDDALFHGDPHAGNIFVEMLGGREPGLVLLDWTLAGHLPRSTRGRIVDLMRGVILGDARLISRAVSALTAGTAAPSSADMLFGLLSGILPTLDQQHDPLNRAFRLLEQLALNGVLFPGELILFRKAFFTLEGVLNHIVPGFSPGRAMEQYLRTLLKREMSRRVTALMSGRPDHSFDYPSLLSSQAVSQLTLYRLLNDWQNLADKASAVLAAQYRLSTVMWGAMWGVKRER